MTDFLERAKELDRLMPATEDEEELLDITAIKALRPPEWLIENYLPKMSLCVMYGPSGGGKSFQAIDWGLSVAAGRHWFTSKVSQGPVIYIAGEGASGLGQRITAWQLDRSMKNADDLPFTARKKRPVNLMERDSVKRFVEFVEDRKPALVIVDTLARAMQGGDENSARDMGVVIGNADWIKESLNCTVLLIHHTNKGGQSERGSGALRGAADSMLALAPEDETVLLTVDKQKDAPIPDPVRLRLCPVMHSGSAVLNLAEFSFASPEMTKDQRKALKALSYFRASGASRNDWKDASELPAGSFAAAVDSLLSKGYVRAPGDDERPKRFKVTGEGYEALQ